MSNTNSRRCDLQSRDRRSRRRPGGIKTWLTPPRAIWRRRWFIRSPR